VIKAILVQQEPRERKEPQVPKEHRELQELKVPRERRVLKEHRVILVVLGKASLIGSHLQSVTLTVIVISTRMMLERG
jgi:hypothetical protein